MKRLGYCLVTCVKNEGPYLLEWLAHYRAIGVQRFLVFSNESTDGTTELLDHLDRRGVVRHLPNPSGVFDEPPHRAALAYAPLHKEFREADYVLISDVDEFLQIDLPEPSLDALMHRFGHPDVLSVSELVYGFGGVATFRDRPVVEQFRLSALLQPGKRKARRGVKSIVRVGPHVAEYSNHRPQIAPDHVDRVRWLDGKGAQVGRDFILGGDRGLDMRGCYDLVRLHHYTLRSGEATLAKFDRGDAVRQDRLQPFYFRRRNKADDYCDSALSLLPGIRAGMEELLADPETRRLHAACVDSYRARLPALRARMADVWAQIETEVAASGARLEELRGPQAAE